MIDFLKKTIHQKRRFLTFLAIGGLNTLFGYSIYAGLLWMGLHYTVAAGIALVIGILFNFKTTGVIVFRSHDNRLIIRFFLMYLFVYIVNILGLTLLKQIGINAYYGGLIMIAPQAILTYILSCRYVFGKEKL